MALVLRNIGTWLYNTHNYRDAKLDHYPIVNYPFFGIITVIVYLPLVSSILPTFMKNREAFNLKPFILVYNAFQILYNGFIVIKVLSVVISSGYDPFKCFESNSSESRLLVTIYFLNKLADLIETVLFALRKKQSQVSALHLIHHIYAILSAHYAIFLEQPGPIILSMALNAAIHIVMYSYYSLIAYGIKFRWITILKKSITKMQMCQLVVMLLLSCTIFLPDCKTPNHVGLITVHEVLLVYYMFHIFYKNAYNKNVKHE